MKLYLKQIQRIPLKKLLKKKTNQDDTEQYEANTHETATPTEAQNTTQDDTKQSEVNTHESATKEVTQANTTEEDTKQSEAKIHENANQEETQENIEDDKEPANTTPDITSQTEEKQTNETQENKPKPTRLKLENVVTTEEKIKQTDPDQKPMRVLSPRSISERPKLNRTSSTGAILRKVCHTCLLDKKKMFYAKKEWLKREFRKCKNCSNAGKSPRVRTDKEADELRASEEKQFAEMRSNTTNTDNQ
jgi:hypothetical protein